MNLLSAPLQYGHEIWQSILNEVFREDQRNLKRDVAETINASLRVRGLLDLSDASAGGIKFPATQVPSSDANTLDDYEEGTFTPTISFGGNSVGVTYATQSGAYTKNGNRVLFELQVTISDNGSSTGTALIGGLPFTAGGSISCAVSLLWATVNINAAGGYTAVSGIVGQGGTSIGLHEVGDNVNNAGLTEANIPNNAALIISGHYRT